LASVGANVKDAPQFVFRKKTPAPNHFFMHSLLPLLFDACDSPNIKAQFQQLSASPAA
jgi:hypothetical protein